MKLGDRVPESEQEVRLSRGWIDELHKNLIAIEGRLDTLEAKAKEPVYTRIVTDTEGREWEVWEKAKEPENLKVCCESHHPDAPKPSGWRAREWTLCIDTHVNSATVVPVGGHGDPANPELIHRPTVEIHPRAVRVRMHTWFDDETRTNIWSECRCGSALDLTRVHAEFLQVSSEPAVKP